MSCLEEAQAANKASNIITKEQGTTNYLKTSRCITGKNNKINKNRMTTTTPTGARKD